MRAAVLTAKEFDVSLKKAKFDNCDSLTAFGHFFAPAVIKTLCHLPQQILMIVLLLHSRNAAPVSSSDADMRA